MCSLEQKPAAVSRWLTSMPQYYLKMVQPLTSIINEAIYIGTEADDIQGIKSGQYHLIFGSQELLFGNEKWRVSPSKTAID